MSPPIEHGTRRRHLMGRRPRRDAPAGEAVVPDRGWDVAFIVSFFLLVMAASHLTVFLGAGDWDFWTDWKDQQWWPIAVPVAAIIIPSTVQYIAWTKLRLPLGATVTAVALWVAAWSTRSAHFFGWAYFPLNFVWPSTVVIGAVYLDLILLATRSFLATSFFGAFVWGALFMPSNWPAIAPFLQPVDWAGRKIALADLQGIEYIRSQTPEYIRIIEHGSLRTFLQETAYVSAAFAGFICFGTYWIGQFVGRVLAVWPINRFFKRLP